MNLSLAELRNRTKVSGGEGRMYVVETARPMADSPLITQKGSAPNFQGGRITLCTCKHRMRAGQAVDWWEGKWIAGFSKKGCGQPQRLFYLLQVESAHESHAELWAALPPDVREAKSMRHSRFGDIVEPLASQRHGNATDRFNPACYHNPHARHVHIKDDGWHRDLNQALEKGRKRRAALLLGTQRMSFLWSEPLLKLRNGEILMQGERTFGTLESFLDRLEEVQ